MNQKKGSSRHRQTGPISDKHVAVRLVGFPVWQAGRLAQKKPQAVS